MNYFRNIGHDKPLYTAFITNDIMMTSRLVTSAVLYNTAVINTVVVPIGKVVSAGLRPQPQQKAVVAKGSINRCNALQHHQYNSSTAAVYVSATAVIVALHGIETYQVPVYECVICQPTALIGSKETKQVTNSTQKASGDMSSRAKRAPSRVQGRLFHTTT